MMEDSSDREIRKILLSLLIPGGLVLLITVSFITSELFSLNLYRLGIYPLSLEGAAGIVTSPFVHADAKHLFNNALPILLLGTAIFYFYPTVAFRVFFGVYLFSGLWVWLVARDSWHIGASGLVYGYAFFIFFSGIFRRSIPLLALSLLVAFIYGSMVWGMFPHFFRGISWEGHMLGSLAGLMFAVIYRREGPVYRDPEWLDEDTPGFEESPDGEDDNSFIEEEADES